LTKYQMLATDPDDSLLDDRLMIAPVDRGAIQRAVKAGVINLFSMRRTDPFGGILCRR